MRGSAVMLPSGGVGSLARRSVSRPAASKAGVSRVAVSATAAAWPKGLGGVATAVPLRSSSFTPGLAGEFRCHNTASTQVNRRKVVKMEDNGEIGRDPDSFLIPDASAPKGKPKLWARIASMLPYFIPWVDALGIMFPLMMTMPHWAFFFYLPMPVVSVYACSPVMPLLIFFGIYLCVVRNQKMPHFLRFNCLQAILIDIAGMLVTLLNMYMPAEMGVTLFRTVFCGVAATSMIFTVSWCMYCAFFGIYADIPEISNAVYMQVQQAGMEGG